jgi:hypothetical protein
VLPRLVEPAQVAQHGPEPGSGQRDDPQVAGGPFAGRWFPALGGAAAVLIAAGVLSPLHVPSVDLANFVGYVLWSVWLVAFALLVLRRRVPAAGTVPILAGGTR